MKFNSKTCCRSYGILSIKNLLCTWHCANANEVHSSMFVLFHKIQGLGIWNKWKPGKSGSEEKYLRVMLLTVD